MAEKGLIGERIKDVRLRRGITRAWLAKRIGISTQGLHAIETGAADPRASRIADIAKALRVSSDYLLGVKDEEDLGDRVKQLSLA